MYIIGAFAKYRTLHFYLYKDLIKIGSKAFAYDDLIYFICHNATDLINIHTSRQSMDILTLLEISLEDHEQPCYICMTGNDNGYISH